MNWWRRVRRNEDDDRISSMPDPILLEILSLTGTKEAVQTCTLSKRWRYLWKSIPNLNFNPYDFNFFYVDVLTSDDDDRERRRAFYKNFVNRVLSLRDNSNVVKFSLSGRHYIEADLVKKCISYAIRHNVQCLDIDSPCDPKPFRFPASFFTCESVRELKLTFSCKGMHILRKKSFCLPALKTLCLKRFPFGEQVGGCFTGELFSRFPNLETLTLKDCRLSKLRISAPQLMNLEISYAVHSYALAFGSVVLVSTPRLISFKVQGPVCLDFSSMVNLACLDKVFINLLPRADKPITIHMKQRMLRKLIKMLGHLRNAKSVALSVSTIEVLQTDSGSLSSQPSPFSNLRNLKLIAVAQRGDSTLTLPLSAMINVITYLKKGSSSCDDVLVEFPKVD